MTRLLRAEGYVRLLGLPAVPVRNTVGLRYPERYPVSPDGEPWYLRSWGVDFDFAGRAGRHGAANWYSLGWGLVDGREAPDLLLLQGWTTDPPAAERQLTRIAALCGRFARVVEPAGDRFAVRAAALLTREPEGE